MKNIYYYVQNKDKYLKYEVIFNREKVKELRKEIINNCSKIKHKEFNSTIYSYLLKEPEKYRNVTYKPNGYKDHQDGPDETIYSINYDEYIFPKLVNIIDNIINNNINKSVLAQLFSPNEKNNNFFNEKINELSNLIDTIPNIEVDNKIQKLYLLKDLIEQAKINENRISVYEYYLKVQNMIDFKLVDSISLNEINRINNFFSEEEFEKEKILVKKIQEKK